MTSDAYNFILCREMIIEEGKTKGQKVLRPIGYYPTIIQALEACLSKKLGESTTRTLKGLVNEHHALVAYFKEMLGTELAMPKWIRKNGQVVLNKEWENENKGENKPKKESK